MIRMPRQRSVRFISSPIVESSRTHDDGDARSAGASRNPTARWHGPALASCALVRSVVFGIALSLAVPAPAARAGSTIRLVPKSDAQRRSSEAEVRGAEEEPSKPESRAPAKATSEPPSAGAAADPASAADPEPAPAAATAAPGRPLDLSLPPPSSAFGRATPPQPPPPERPAGPPVVPLIGIGVSVLAGVIGTVLLVEAGNNLDSDNFVIETRGEGEDLEVELSDRFVDAQNAVIGNGIAGSVFVSSATAGLLASIMLLVHDRR